MSKQNKLDIKKLLPVIIAIIAIIFLIAKIGPANLINGLLGDDTIADTVTDDTTVPDDTAADDTTKADETTEAEETTEDKETTKAEETTTAEETTKAEETTAEKKIDANGVFYDKDNVALYIHTYGKLPKNFVTKSTARNAGWSGGSVQKYIEGAAIGGDKFSNNEGLLPKKNGRQYYECDIDTNGKKERGAKRIIYSNDGLVYYTDDHYESFTLLYGKP